MKKSVFIIVLLTLLILTSINTLAGNCSDEYTGGDWIINDTLTCGGPTILNVDGSILLKDDSESVSFFFSNWYNNSYPLQRNTSYIQISDIDLSLATPNNYTHDLDSETNEFYASKNETGHQIILYINATEQNKLYWIDIDNKDTSGTRLTESAEGYDYFVGEYMGTVIQGCYNSTSKLPQIITEDTICNTDYDSNLERDFIINYTSSGNVTEVLITTTGNWIDKKIVKQTVSDPNINNYKWLELTDHDGIGPSIGHLNITGWVTINLEGNLTLERGGIFEMYNSQLESQQTKNGSVNILTNIYSQLKIFNSNLTTNNTNYYWGLYLLGGNHLIKGNTITNNGAGNPGSAYHNTIKTNTTIENNNFTKCAENCISLEEGANGTLIANNTFANQYGANVYFTEAVDEITLSNNIFTDIYFYRSGTDINITNNTFINLGEGIAFSDEYGGNINFINNNFSQPFQLSDTNISLIDNLIYSNSYGQIKWSQGNLTLLDTLSLTDKINISENFIEFQPTIELSNLNNSAEITFYNMGSDAQPFVLKNGIRCDNTLNCNITYWNEPSGTLIVNISSFSNYTTENITQSSISCGTTIYDDTILSGPLLCNDTALIIGDNDITLDCDSNVLENINNTNEAQGIIIDGFDNITIRNCTIKSYKEGINVSNSNQSTLFENSIENFEVNQSLKYMGFLIHNSQNLNISQNNFNSINCTNNCQGFYSIATTGGDYENLTIENNIFSYINGTADNPPIGISINIYDASITSNKINITKNIFYELDCEDRTTSNCALFKGGNAISGNFKTNQVNIEHNQIINLGVGILLKGVNHSLNNNTFQNNREIGLTLGYSTGSTNYTTNSTNISNCIFNSSKLALGINSQENKLININFTNGSIQDASGQINELKYYNTFGYINWNSLTNISITNTNLSIVDNIYIKNNTVGLNDISSLARLDNAATIQITSNYTSQPYLYKDGTRCDNVGLCNILSWNAINQKMIATVTSFSNYTTSNISGSTPVIPDNGGGGGDEPGCSSNNDCSDSQTCSGGECIAVTGTCGFAEDHAWTSYECCSDSDCSDSQTCSNHQCTSDEETPLEQLLENSPTITGTENWENLSIIFLDDGSKVKFYYKDNKPVLDLDLSGETVVGDYRSIDISYIPLYFYLILAIGLLIAGTSSSIYIEKNKIDEDPNIIVEKLKKAVNKIKTPSKRLVLIAEVAKKLTKEKKETFRREFNLLAPIKKALRKTKTNLTKKKHVEIIVKKQVKVFTPFQKQKFFTEELIKGIRHLEVELTQISRKESVTRYNALVDLSSSLESTLTPQQLKKINEKLIKLRKVIFSR